MALIEIENIVDLERLAWPTLSLIISFVVWLFAIVALATPGWVTLNLFRPVNDSFIPSGNITIGLIRTTERIDTEFGLQGETFFTYFKYEDATDVIPIAMTIACIALVVIVCVAAMVFEFINTYYVRKSIILGPATVYILTLATSALLAAGCASFTHFYLYIDTSGILNVSRHETLKFNHYTAEKELFYSSYFIFVATVLSILPFLFSWRLAVLLPTFYTPDILEKMNISLPQIAPDRQFVMMDVDPTDIDDFEGGSEDADGSFDASDGESSEDDDSSDSDVELSDEGVNEMLEEYQSRK